MIGLIHISFGGPTRFICAGGKIWRFEDHPRFGPIVLKKNDDPSDNQPPERSPFWHAYEHWSKQGKRLDQSMPDRTFCVWDNPRARPPKSWVTP